MNYESIIILGYKRSGTSLLRVLLNSHPQIAVGPEMKFMQRVVKKYPADFTQFVKVTEREASDFEYTQETLKKIYDASSSADELMRNWCVEYKNKTGKEIWGDKTPQNFKYLGLLRKKFRQTLYVHIVRNPFDVMVSSKKRDQFQGMHTIIAWFVSNFQVRQIKKDNLIFFRYEDFAKDPKKHIDIILNKLGAESADLVSSYQQHNHGRMAEGDSWNKPIFEPKERDEKVLSMKDKILIKLICFPYLKKYGYT